MPHYRVYSDKSRFAVGFDSYDKAEKYAEMKAYETEGCCTIMQKLDERTPWHRLTTISA